MLLAESALIATLYVHVSVPAKMPLSLPEYQLEVNAMDEELLQPAATATVSDSAKIANMFFFFIKSPSKNNFFEFFLKIFYIIAHIFKFVKIKSQFYEIYCENILKFSLNMCYNKGK